MGCIGRGDFGHNLTISYIEVMNSYIIIIPFQISLVKYNNIMFQVATS